MTVLATACASGDGEVIARTEQATSTPTASTFPATYARQWMTNLGNCAKQDGAPPTIAARAYTYGAVSIYESVVNGMPGYRSLGGQLNGLGTLPVPDSSLAYDWPTVLAQTMHRVAETAYVYPLRVFFEYTTSCQSTLQSLGRVQIGFRRQAGVPEATINNSVNYGNQLADVLVAWMSSDGYKEARFKGFLEPEGPDKWVPSGFGNEDRVINPLEPGFGNVRPAVLTSAEECPLPGPPEYSDSPSSTFYAEANYIHSLYTNTNPDLIKIARFWEDFSGTSAPPGHWVNLATKEVRSKSLAEAAAGYAQSTLATMDAFIAVWHYKFKYNLIRPIDYVRKNIDPNWRPILNTPPFPSYPSGHSTGSGAAGVMMTATFGDHPVTDDTKVRLGYEVRTFPNYTEAAEEAARSRLYGGIHYRFDDHDGIEMGRCIANKALSRVQFKL